MVTRVVKFISLNRANAHFSLPRMNRAATPIGPKRAARPEDGEGTGERRSLWRSWDTLLLECKAWGGRRPGRLCKSARSAESTRLGLMGGQLDCLESNE